MMKRNISKAISKLLYLLLLLFLLTIDFTWIPPFDSVFIKEAEAVVRRAAPAGAHHRHRRTTVRRRQIAVGTRVTVLPAGCTTVITHNVTYRHCGGVYYRPYYEGTTVIYIVEEP